MLIGKLCSREVVVIEAHETVVEAARLLAEHHVGCLVVVSRSGGDENKAVAAREPVGIVTDRDITLRAVAHGAERIESRKVEEIMTRQLLTAYEEEDLYDVLKQMRSRGVRRVPVLNDNDMLVGILAHADVLDWLAEEVWDLTRLLARERDHERDGTHLGPSD